MENYAVGGISILFLIMGLTQFAKNTFSLSGNKVKVVSMILGVIFGILYQVSLGVTSLQQIIFIIFFGLAVGLSATGIYDVWNKGGSQTTINTQNVSLPMPDEPSQ